MRKEYCPKCQKMVDTYTTTDEREDRLITLPVKVTWVTYF